MKLRSLAIRTISLLRGHSQIPIICGSSAVRASLDCSWTALNIRKLLDLMLTGVFDSWVHSITHPDCGLDLVLVSHGSELPVKYIVGLPEQILVLILCLYHRRLLAGGVLPTYKR